MKTHNHCLKVLPRRCGRCNDCLCQEEEEPENTLTTTAGTSWMSFNDLSQAYKARKEVAELEEMISETIDRLTLLKNNSEDLALIEELEEILEILS